MSHKVLLGMNLLLVERSLQGHVKVLFLSLAVPQGLLEDLLLVGQSLQECIELYLYP
jgi:hypothetical protein